MSRPAEAALVLAAAALAAFGVSLVNFADGGSIDAQTALTFLVFALAFGSLLVGMRAWASSAVPFLIPLAATISAVGFVTVYRLDRELADLQRWWLLLGSGLAVLALYLMRNSGLDPLRRYRYLFLAGAIALLLLPLLPTSGPFPLSRTRGKRLASVGEVRRRRANPIPARRGGQAACWWSSWPRSWPSARQC